LEEVNEIPPGWSKRASSELYDDIIKVFIETQYAKAKVTVEGKNPDTVARRLESRVDSTILVKSRGDGVYLVNQSLPTTTIKEGDV